MVVSVKLYRANGSFSSFSVPTIHATLTILILCAFQYSFYQLTLNYRYKSKQESKHDIITHLCSNNTTISPEYKPENIANEMKNDLIQKAKQMADGYTDQFVQQTNEMLREYNTNSKNETHTSIDFAPPFES